MESGSDSYNNMFSLQGKSIIVTGGAGYLGRTMVQALLAFGAEVSVADRVEYPVAPDSAEGKAKLHSLICDLELSASIRQMFAQASEISGKIDVLVNCAAYGGGSGGKGIGGDLSLFTDEIWEKGIDGTLGVTFRCIREALPYFYANKGGNIINIASMYGLVSPNPGLYGTSGQNSPPTYGAGKAGVLQLTRYCAANLAARSIRVNCLTPGSFANPQGNLTDDFRARLNASNMLGRVGRPEELTGALVLLASDASSYMTGSNIVIDGGWTAW
ncbi:MAG TPA: gluconate 5-dehydrogenase [Clostridiales bacterium]|nr:gluconate 5-dehydrogenase [Clostridiales bacterium]